MSQNTSSAVMQQRVEAREEWRQITGWPGYDVSSLGRVRSWKQPGKGRKWREDRSRPPRILKQDRSNGYRSVLLKDIQRGKLHALVHSLVLEAFVGPRPTGEQGCHNDGDPSNNAVGNLRWDTPVGNNSDKRRHGTHQYGSRLKSAKLTEANALEIRARRVHGEPVTALATEFGVCRNTITNLTTGRTWREVAHAAE